MASFMEMIERYSFDMSDFDVSPFEMHYGLSLRSELEKHWDEMENEEQLQLLSADLEVIRNAEKILNHLKEVYDFSNSTQPETEWWWHLDKVLSGEIKVKGNPLYTNRDIAL